MSSVRPAGAPLLLRFPFTGRWVAQNSPADRVPSHGTHAFGSSHAIDFVAVDEHGRSAPRGWRSAFATEPPDRFIGFDAPVLAPVDGSVVIAHDREPDHEARRSPLTLLPYLLSQSRRAQQSAGGLAGNHVVIAAREAGPFVLLAHLRRGSMGVRVGDVVRVGMPIGRCGNSGNSTEPHVHVQASDSIEWSTARGIPIAFASAAERAGWMPRNRVAFDVK
ncbi:peptidoglycan DD-metalloendopeptidase family protein [Agromyces laixinhei]|uniref:peptidoglycan DD-metalloendopeptidase family protein n=1 Tax=Agromyces laixinhei TaxID=2585717 RepID=UPI0011179DC2|nr:peptidoglycan DD-metalloendopeptidase family protein [Agromyces laixinhei]